MPENSSNGFRVVCERTVCRFLRNDTVLASLRTETPVLRVEESDDGAFALHTTTHRISVKKSDEGWTLKLPAGAGCWIDLPAQAHWYGQGSFVRQAFPLDRMSLALSPLMTWDNGPSGHSCIQEALWLSSNGIAVMCLNSAEQLKVGINPQGDTPPDSWGSVFDSSGAARPMLATHSAARRLQFQTDAALELWLVFKRDLPTAYYAALQVIGHPTTTPPTALLSAPIWTTWAHYKDAISADKVRAFAEAIRANGYPGNTLEIDDRWQSAYGATTFDPARFPAPAELIAHLRTLGFATTLWITPFLSADADNTAEAAQQGYLVKRQDGRPYPITWWRGEAFLLDLTHPKARAWWANRLQALQQATGIAGYKFDAGEANFLPPDAVTHQPIERSTYSTLWAAFAAIHFPYGEARCGWHNQRAPILFRQWDKFSIWGDDNGLASVITGALNLGLIGYPFVLPDMVGGNAYQNTVSPELMVRWTQACAPMLAIQFSIPPWELGDETHQLCLRYAKLHVDLAPCRLEAALRATRNGTPPIRPMIWAAPDHPEATVIADQYLLGDKLLVAPVLQAGQTSRDIWLPPGQWRDFWNGTVHPGGWLRAYPAPLEMLPMFERVAA